MPGSSPQIKDERLGTCFQVMSMAKASRSRKNLIASLAVWLLILLYIGLFSWQSVARHQAFATNAYDLGNVNQAFWNTVHGRPLHFTNWRGVELDLANDSRLAMHVEPIYFVLAPIYWLWQQPETILILQTIILALGALPVFWLARDRLRSHLAGVAFAAVYLLFPGLEAANMWEFHAVALAAPLLLFAFYFGQKGRWGLLWLFAILAMATKEEVSLSVLVMGFCFSVWGLIQAWRKLAPPINIRTWLRRAAGTPLVIHGLALMLVAALWFVVAVFVVVPHFEGSRSPYLSYYNQLSGDAASGGSGIFPMLIAALHAMFTRRNVQYLIDLYTPVAFLSLFNPLTLAISAPDLAINLLSTHEPMHFTEKYHYVAPLLPGIMISAILGVAWLSRQIARLTKRRQHTVVLALTGIVFASTLYYHHYHGYTPLARAFESYQVTSHHRVGASIAREIPIDAAVSAQPNLNPHVSGRKTLYRFPYIGDAEYIFLDVSSLANKSDQYGLIRDLLAGDEFGLVRAEDGYLLFRRGAPHAPLPETFGGYARVPASPDGTLLHQPQYRTDIVFGDALRLVGFDILDGRHTEMPQTPLRFFFYWQVLKPLDQDYRFALYLLDDHRQVAGTIDLGELPGVQTWYPPTRSAARRDDQNGDQRHALVDGPVRQVRGGARRACRRRPVGARCPPAAPNRRRRSGDSTGRRKNAGGADELPHRSGWHAGTDRVTPSFRTTERYHRSGRGLDKRRRVARLPLCRSVRATGRRTRRHALLAGATAARQGLQGVRAFSARGSGGSRNMTPSPGWAVTRPHAGLPGRSSRIAT